MGWQPNSIEAVAASPTGTGTSTSQAFFCLIQRSDDFQRNNPWWISLDLCPPKLCFFWCYLLNFKWFILPKGVWFSCTTWMCFQNRVIFWNREFTRMCFDHPNWVELPGFYCSLRPCQCHVSFQCNSRSKRDRPSKIFMCPYQTFGLIGFFVSVFKDSSSVEIWPISFNENLITPP